MWKIGITGVATLLVAFISSCVPSNAQVSIRLDPGTQHQVMTGWSATAQTGHHECPAGAYNRYKDEVLDRAVSELGLNRIRLEVRSGVENPVDYFTQWKNGQLTFSEWAGGHWYEVVNDNADPNTRNEDGFHFGELDDTIKEIVQPLRQRLQAQGETLFVNLTYVAFRTNVNTHSDNPEEYAEFVLAVYEHMQSRWGFVPDSWEIILEPDNTSNWTGAKIGRAIVTAAERLQEAGFTPRFVAPSTSAMGGMWRNFFAEMASVPGVMPYISELAYHRYGGATLANLDQIAQRAQQYGVGTAMLEAGAGRSDHEVLHDDLLRGYNTAWQQFGLAFCNANDNGGKYFLIDTSNPNNPVVTMGKRSKYYRQYFKWVRRGAQRIGATSTNSSLSPLAFINTDGKYTVVVKASSGASIQVNDLPAGTYGVRYTTESAYDVDAGDVTVSAGETLQTNIPAAGVITIYAKTKPSQNTPIESPDQEVPQGFLLHQNYPNPFDLTTTIVFDIPATTHTVLRIFDVLGKEVVLLVDETLLPGRYRASWDAHTYPDGTYFAYLEAGSYKQAEELILVK